MGMWRETGGGNLKNSCLQIPISGECQPLSGIFHFPEVSLTSVTNQEAWKWPIKAAMAPKRCPHMLPAQISSG